VRTGRGRTREPHPALAYSRPPALPFCHNRRGVSTADPLHGVRTTAIGVVSIGLIAVSMGAILVRFSQQAPSLTIAAYRMVFAVLWLAPFYLGFRRRAVRGSWSVWHGLAGIALALHFAFWISSLRFTGVAVSVLLVNTSPVFVAAVAHFALGERLTRAGLAGLAAALGGSFLLGRGDLQTLGDWRGAALALAGAVALAAYLMIGRRLRQGSDLLGYVYPTYAISALVLVLAVLGSGIPWTGFDGTTYVYLALLGLVPQAIGHTSYNWSLRYLPATTVSTLIVGEPVLAGLFAWWLLGERLEARVIPGGVLVLTGILLVSFGGVRATAPVEGVSPRTQIGR
jgi:drug/metabolite transporter (DMT)-like permease